MWSLIRNAFGSLTFGGFKVIKESCNPTHINAILMFFEVSSQFAVPGLNELTWRDVNVVILGRE